MLINEEFSSASAAAEPDARHVFDLLTASRRCRRRRIAVVGTCVAVVAAVSPLALLNPGLPFLGLALVVVVVMPTSVSSRMSVAELWSPPPTAADRAAAVDLADPMMEADPSRHQLVVALCRSSAPGVVDFRARPDLPFLFRTETGICQTLADRSRSELLEVLAVSVSPLGWLARRQFSASDLAAPALVAHEAWVKVSALGPRALEVAATLLPNGPRPTSGARSALHASTLDGLVAQTVEVLDRLGPIPGALDVFVAFGADWSGTAADLIDVAALASTPAAA